jgi:hypothetical protein
MLAMQVLRKYSESGKSAAFLDGVRGIKMPRKRRTQKREC